MGLLTYIEKNVFNGKNTSSEKESSSSNREDSKENSPVAESSWDNWKPVISVVR